MPRFSIIIVTYDSAKHVRSCFESILRQDFKDYELLIVDNCSRDETRHILNEYKGRAELIFNVSNTGFPKGINLGISRSSGEYVLTLNPDVVLERDFLTQADRFIRELGGRIGMVAPKMMKDALSRRIDSTGLVLSWAYRFYDRGNESVDEGQFDDKADIFGPCAAAGLYSRKMLEEIKVNGEYFDDDFFLLIEDFDLAWRARNRGWKAAFAPQLVCYHHGGISRQRSPLGQYYTFRNRYLLILKNASACQMLRLALLLPVYELPRLIFLLCINNKNTKKALKEIWKLVPSMLKKRAAARNNPVVFRDSRQYWEERYASGGDSGSGSYGALAEFKAEVLNDFVAQKRVRSVIEFGCGDGHQLSLARYPEYTGLDVSKTAVARCRKRFAQDRTKRFLHLDEYSGQKAELAMSLDVIFHLVEEPVFEEYMRMLFAASEKYVIVYSSDIDKAGDHPHVLHRRFTVWVSENEPGWKLAQHIPSRFAKGKDGREGSMTDFFIYER